MQEFDYSEEVSLAQIAEPDVYELKIENAELKKSEAGKEFIALTVQIRDDVEQNFAGVNIWDNIWKNEVHRNVTTGKRIKKETFEAMSPADKQNVVTRMEYDDYKIRTLLHSQDESSKFKFASIEEVAMFLNGLCFQAKITKDTDNKTGKERNTLDYKSIKKTSVPAGSANVEVNDNDLPF